MGEHQGEIVISTKESSYQPPKLALFLLFVAICGFFGVQKLTPIMMTVELIVTIQIRMLGMKALDVMQLVPFKSAV